MSHPIEFSRPVKVTDIPVGGLVREIEATAEECAALARRFGLVSLESLSAEIRLKPRPGQLIELTGRLSSRLAQACVLTLGPVSAEIEDAFETVFTTDPAAVEPTPEEIEADESLLDAPEPIPGGNIDLGELTAQYLYLALDPHPIAEGAQWPEDGMGDAAESPFAALLKKQ